MNYPKGRTTAVSTEPGCTGTTMTNEDLIAALQGIAQKHWDTHKTPTLLSQLPKLLSTHLQADYKPILGTVSLKSFIKTSQGLGGYRLVEHPTQRAKLGIVPPGVDFEFPVTTDEKTISTLSRQDIEGFARVLGALTPDELRHVSLPATLVIKLLETK